MRDEMTITTAVFGYCDRFDQRPGEPVTVLLHSERPTTAEIDLVRLHGADRRVTVALPLAEPVEAVAPQQVAIGPQRTDPGSCAVADGLHGLADGERLELELWLLATAPRRAQGIVSTLAPAQRPDAGLLLALDDDGHLTVAVGADGSTTELLRTAAPLPAGCWLHVRLRADRGRGTVALAVERLTRPGGPTRPIASAEGARPHGATHGGRAGRVVLAAAGADVEQGRPRPRQSFDGKLEGVVLRDGDRLLAAWEFARDISSRRALDSGPHGCHAALVNGPTRAVTGHAWDGRVLDWRLDAAQYGAIHFHADDLDDAGWTPTARIVLPPELESGFYAVRVRSPEGDDEIPLIVLPPVAPTRRAQPRVALLAPTFTYQAYANASLGDRIDYVADGLSGRGYEPGPRDAQLGANLVFAGSLYDVHRDGSGRSASTLLRPIFNFRADYRSAVQQAFRHLGADLYLTGWLDHEQVAHDVLTDHLLDERGAAALDGYDVLVTGSHPEYVSETMLDALHVFLERGGRVMYLGGNGFYWVTSRDLHRIETRRGHAGTRTWESRPGEVHHEMTGEPGGLWRHRGRAPNVLVGVGMASQGWDERAPGYRRTAASEEPRAAWVFDGVAGDRFGTEGLVMDGAAGDELDRFDERLGSPADAVVLATSEPHSRFYKAVVEDVPMIRDGLGGDQNRDVRSDVVLFETAGGGAVFSVGSIAWAGALAFADFDNPVARVTTNVLRRFLEPGSPLSPTSESESESR